MPDRTAPEAGKTNLSPYRWVIEALLLLALLAQTSAWLAPAPILTPIIKSLGITLAKAGLVISVIALCTGIFAMIGAVVMGRLGARGAMLTGMWILAMGEILSGYSATFWELMACRVIEGIGYGVCVGPLGAFQMQWFGENEWAYINTLNTVGSSLGIAAVFWITAPAFVALGSSWALVFRYYGFGCAGVALLWTILGRERTNPAGKASHAIAARRSSIIGEVIRMRNVILVAIALFTQLWVGQLYTAFLPRYFHVYRGLGLTEASALTAVMPTAGMFAAVIGGLGTGFIRLRKPFLWPIAACTLVGCAAAVTLHDPVMIRLALVLVGIGGTGAGTAIVTLVMELPGMTPQKVGTAMALVWSVAYFGAFLAPLLGGAIAGAIGLRQVMLASLVLTLIQITSMFLLPETGSGQARERIAVAS